MCYAALDVKLLHRDTEARLSGVSAPMADASAVVRGAGAIAWLRRVLARLIASPQGART